MSSKVCVVTGSTGFIGRSVCTTLPKLGRRVRAIARYSGDPAYMTVGEIGPSTDWSAMLVNAESVVHLAARVHLTSRNKNDALREFRLVNVEGTRRLAEQAAQFGVKRFVFLSSIKVNGETTADQEPFRSTDMPAPLDAYGQSKAEAEAVLSDLAARTGMEVVIIRPPLVYGCGVKGNFARLVKLVGNGIPLPFASVKNLRSFVSLDNLVDLLARCLEHPSAAGQTFLASDGNDMSTPDLIQGLARAMNRNARLFSVSPNVLRACGAIMKRGYDVERLIGSLQVDISYTCERLDWRPPISVAEGLRRTCT